MSLKGLNSGYESYSGTCLFFKEEAAKRHPALFVVGPLSVRKGRRVLEQRRIGTNVITITTASARRGISKGPLTNIARAVPRQFQEKISISDVKHTRKKLTTTVFQGLMAIARQSAPGTAKRTKERTRQPPIVPPRSRQVPVYSGSNPSKAVGTTKQIAWTGHQVASVAGRAQRQVDGN